MQPEVRVNTRTLSQIGFLTRDLPRSMEKWSSILGVGHWEIVTATDATFRSFEVEGKLLPAPFKFLIGIASIGDMQIELIQPVYPNFHQAFLERKGEGLHHIKERIDDDKLGSVLEAYRHRGLSVIQTGVFFDDLHYFLDTDSLLDVIFEIGNCAVMELPPSVVSVHELQQANEPEALNAGRSLSQIGLVSSDLRRSIANWEQVLGIGPWTIAAFDQRNLELSVCGQPVTEPFSFLTARAVFGAVEIEIVQPISGPSIYASRLERPGPGLFYIKERISPEQLQDAVSRYGQKGIGVLQSERSDARVCFYLDTPPVLDFVYAIG